MKKLLLVSFVALSLGACSQVRNTGVNSTRIMLPTIETKPMEASLKVGEKVVGSATCKSLFGFAYEGPEKEAYGASLQVSDGNVAPSKCTRGAIYNAMSKSKADVLVAPRYEVQSVNRFCIPLIDACAYRESVINVVGYKGTIKNITEMPEDVVKARQMIKEIKEIKDFEKLSVLPIKGLPFFK